MDELALKLPLGAFLYFPVIIIITTVFIFLCSGVRTVGPLQATVRTVGPLQATVRTVGPLQATVREGVF